jgi:hypothetical protein
MMKKRKLIAVKPVSTRENKGWMWKTSACEKQDLTWKSRTLLFQSPSWKSEKSRERKRDRLRLPDSKKSRAKNKRVNF